MSRPVAIAVVVLCSGTAQADTSDATFGWFGEVSAWVGKMSTSYKDIPPRSINPTVTNLQASFGLTVQFDPELPELRVGPVLDGFLAESAGTAFGGAVDLTPEITWVERGIRSERTSCDNESA